MKKIEDYFPSHAKRAANFQRNLLRIMSNNPSFESIYFYDFCAKEIEDVVKGFVKIGLTNPIRQRLQKNIYHYESQTADRTILGLLALSDFESSLILLDQEASDLCRNSFNGSTLSKFTSISELHEASLSQWALNTAFLFTDK